MTCAFFHVILLILGMHFFDVQGSTPQKRITHTIFSSSTGRPITVETIVTSPEKKQDEKKTKGSNDDNDKDDIEKILKRAFSLIKQAADRTKNEEDRLIASLNKQEVELRLLLERPFDRQDKIKTLKHKKDLVQRLQATILECTEITLCIQSSEKLVHAAKMVHALAIILKQKITYNPNLATIAETQEEKTSKVL